MTDEEHDLFDKEPVRDLVEACYEYGLSKAERRVGEGRMYDVRRFDDKENIFFAVEVATNDNGRSKVESDNAVIHAEEVVDD